MTNHILFKRARSHRWPVCPATGKRRLGERKDIKLSLMAARAVRAKAVMNGTQSTWTVVRGYQCSACEGWHLTSMRTNGGAR